MITLIRYANRKIYNPNLGVRRYIVSADILYMLRSTNKVRILNHRTREDATVKTLMAMGALLARQGRLTDAKLLTKYAEVYNDVKN